MGEMQIPLTQGAFALIDEEDASLIEGHQWRLHRRSTQGTEWLYAYAGNHPDQVSMHRLIIGAPEDQEVDHINGNGLDNRRANLRLCTHTENMQNRRIHSNNTSGYKGVRYDGSIGRWRAAIKANKRRFSLGTFSDPIDAARAYDQAALEHHGAFARLNFPREVA